MMNLLATLALLAASGAGAAPASAAAPPAADAPAAQAYDLRVRIWADEDRDFFRSGDRMRVQFHATRSAYVAVIHLTTDGEVEFLYPASPWDDGYVRAGRNYSLPYGGSSGYWRVRGSPGIGYLYVVASEEPLDFRAFSTRSGSAWEYRRIGSGVRGDPYYALDRITELLVPDHAYGEFATDYYAYHVGSRHRYPRYACWDGYADAYSWGAYYDRCDRLVVLLRDDPYYYDPRRYRRSHGYYLADARRSQPQHRYKEPAAAVGRDYDRDRGRDYRAPPLRRSGGSGSSRDDVTRTRPRVDAPVLERQVDWRQEQQPRQTEQERRRAREQQERRRDEERSRPVLQRRPTEPETSRPRVTAPQREPRREAPPERTRSEAPPRQERPRPSDEGSARVRPEGNQ